MSYYYEPFWTADYEKGKLPPLPQHFSISRGIESFFKEIFLPPTISNTQNDNTIKDGGVKPPTTIFTSIENNNINKDYIQPFLQNIKIPRIPQIPQTTFTQKEKDYISKGLLLGVTVITVYYILKK